MTWSRVSLSPPPSLSGLRRPAEQSGADEPGVRGHVDVQHGAVRGGRGAGGGGRRLPDPPGQDQQEEEEGVPEAAVQR